MRIIRLLLASMLAPVALPVVAAAQEVVQPLPNPASAELAEAMDRLARNPESVPALVEAGRASLALNDPDAALGFFSRAQLIAPEDGRALAGLALVALRDSNSVAALQYFEQAEKVGQPMGQYAAERGLAFDLVGNNTRAQRQYRKALEVEQNPVVIRRLALSHAIAGNAAASEQVLLPLLQRQDRAAYRARAFALAILGDTEQAITIAETMLPGRLSRRIAPYLRYMPRLTRAQQAAAANLGRFPPASRIGQEDPVLVALASDRTNAPVAATPDARLIPGGESLGSRTAPEPPAIPEEEVASAADLAAAMSGFELSALAAEPSAERADGELPAPSFSLSRPSAVAAPQAPGKESLLAAFEDLAETAPRPVEVAAQAVDITAIQPPVEGARSAEPAHPARQWVQIATGRDVTAFRFDWRRLGRQAAGLLDGKDAFRAPWGRTNRLLTGPFASSREAQQFVTALAGEGVASFAYASDEGQEITPLD